MVPAVYLSVCKVEATDTTNSLFIERQWLSSSTLIELHSSGAYYLLLHCILILVAIMNTDTALYWDCLLRFPL